MDCPHARSGESARRIRCKTNLAVQPKLSRSLCNRFFSCFADNVIFFYRLFLFWWLMLLECFNGTCSGLHSEKSKAHCTVSEVQKRFPKLLSTCRSSGLIGRKRKRQDRDFFHPPGNVSQTLLKRSGTDKRKNRDFRCLVPTEWMNPEDTLVRVRFNGR